MKRFLQQNMIILVAVAVLFVLNCLLFYPGYYSNDSIQQLSQVVSASPVNDWHPPIMVLSWRILLAITNHTSSMLIFQLFLLWTAIGVLSIVVYRLSGSKMLSFAPIVMGLLPMTLGISGVIWKDVQMTYALLLATSLILLLSTYPYLRKNKVWKWTLLGVSTALIFYAGLLRYNALIAIIPLLYLVINSAGILEGWKKKSLLTISLAIVVAGAGFMGNRIFDIEKTNPTSSVMLDDVINIRTYEELNNHQSVLYETLSDAQNACRVKGIVINSYWGCINEEGRRDISQTYYPELRLYWLGTILTNPFDYISYRLEAFMIFAFAPHQYVFSYQEGVVPNKLGQTVRYTRAQNALQLYVMEFGYFHFPFLFQAWFWIIMSVITLWIGVKKLLRYKKEVIALSASSLIYILSYIPVAVAADYRYVYWSVFATLVATILIAVEKLPGFIKKADNNNQERGRGK